MITVTRNRKKSKLNQLTQKLLHLHDQKAQIGYFQESGTHTLANMSYASLAYIHEFPEMGYHAWRPVIGKIKPMKGMGMNRKFLQSLLKDYIQFGSKYTVKDVLSSIGRKWMQEGKYIFGNSSMLVVTNNPTPLYDTGELSDNFGYRTSIDYTIRYS